MLSAMVTVFAIACNAQPKATDVKPVDKKDTASYALGSNIGRSLKEQGVELNPEMVAAGIRDAMANATLLSEDQIRTVLTSLQEDAQKAQAAAREKAGAASLKKADDFMAQNKTKPGVMVTPSGLQYKVVKEGNGPKPVGADNVRVHYSGTLLDGKKFDSSYDRGAPASFALNQVIPGWTEGLQLMSVGSKYILYVPPQLGYGAQGAGGMIGPNEVLTFEVELLEITK